MSIKLSDSIRVGQQKPLEDKYFNELVPYTSTSQVNTLLPKAIRHRGLTVNINGEEYWYKDGIEDNNLVPKITVSNIQGLQTALEDKLNIPTMTNNYYGLWDDTNKKFINGQLSQDTNGNIGIGATPTNSKVGLSPLVNQTALKISNYSLTGSNNQPALDINGTWNTTGTPTLIKASMTNTASTVNSLLMDLQVNGSSQFSVRRDGIVTFTGPLYINSISNTKLSLMSFGGNGNESVLSNLADNSGTSGQKVFIDAAIGIKPTSGNSTLISFLSRPTINQTGGANGITRGLYVNPTLTSAADWRSIEWSNNTGYGLYGAGSAKNYLEGNLGIGKTSPVEKLDVNGNVKAIDFKGKAVKFDLQASITPTPNTLVPKADGSGLMWYDNNSVLRNIGENFFSADLSNTTARNHTMNAAVTVNTLGNPYSITGLPNKNTDIANFRKVRVQNASGLDSIVDSKNLLTDGVTSMTDAEKDAWRLAQRKTNETYSIGSPQVNAILPPVINGNETFNQFITVVGLNLFVNNSTPSTANLEIRRVKDINGNILSTPDVYTGLNIEVSQNNPTILTTSINFSTMPKGYYKAFVTHNGLTNLTSPEFFVGDAISTIALPSPLWVEQINGSPTSISNTQISSNSASPTTYKSAIVTNASLLQNGFIAEYICEFSGSGAGGGSTGSGTFGIIGSDNVIYGIRIGAIFNGARYSNFMPDNSAMNDAGTIGLTNKMYIVYKNDIVTVINQTTGKVKSFVDPSFKTTDKKAYYSMTGISGNYSNSGSMTFNNIKSF